MWVATSGRVRKVHCMGWGELWRKVCCVITMLGRVAQLLAMLGYMASKMVVNKQDRSSKGWVAPC